MPLVFNNPAYCLERAIKALRLAGKMTDIDGQTRMMAIAEQYQRLAERAMIRLKERPLRERQATVAAPAQRLEAADKSMGLVRDVDVVLKRAISPRIAPE